MVQRISSSTTDRSQAGVVVKDIKILAGRFISCFFKHVSRNSNVVAHSLARSSVRSPCNISVGVILEFIRAEFCNDVM